MKKPEAKCKNCMFWDLDKTGHYLHDGYGTRQERGNPIQTFNNIGECRRHGPIALDTTRRFASTGWPLVKKSDCCGEFKPKEAKHGEEVRVLGLSKRANGCLYAKWSATQIYRLPTISELISRTPKELLVLRGLGKRCLREIQFKLWRYAGLQLKDQNDAAERWGRSGNED